MPRFISLPYLANRVIEGQENLADAHEASKPGNHKEVIEELDRQSSKDEKRKEDTVITTGVGQHQMWAAQHYGWFLM